MKIRAANNYVLVDRYKASDFTSNGLFIPDNAKKLLTKGRVLHVGPKCKYTMKEGDEIVWVQAGVEKWFDDERKPHIFVEEKYILAVIE